MLFGVCACAWLTSWPSRPFLPLGYCWSIHLNDVVVALTLARTIVIGACRITVTAKTSLGGQWTHDVGIKLLWALAQMSTEIIVACLPILRPVFEKIIPRRFTRIHIHSSNHIGTGGPSTSRPNSITVTTRLEVGKVVPFPTLPVQFHDGHQELWGPTFEVARSQAVLRRHTPLSREGPPRAIGCCCLRA
ncbi:hypothetical protein M3J09_004557 [Ascochyta lentis]